jgi:hypothetical protein
VLAGRRLYLSHADGRSVEVVCTNGASSFDASSPAPRMWPLSFDRAPLPFTKNDFKEDAPTVTVFGNLVDASQGKAEREAVLGNGDARQVFQTFTLPKSPLTYFLASAATPPHQPELEIWINGTCGRESMRCSAAARDRSLLVAGDAGPQLCAFGDGEPARLPTGRTMSSRGSQRGGAQADQAGRHAVGAGAPDRLRKVSLAGIVAAGRSGSPSPRGRRAGAESRSHRQRTRARPRPWPSSVVAAAAWDPRQRAPVMLRVLLEAGREAGSAVRAMIAMRSAAAGPIAIR